jgi:hypothetical protein
MTKEDYINYRIIDENGKIDSRFKTIEQGASTTIWAAVAPELDGKGGLYLENCTIGKPVKNPADLFKEEKGYLPYILDSERAEKLWTLSEQLIKNPPKKSSRD